MEALEARYMHAREEPSDIYQHIDTLCGLASTCDSILELGVRSAVSSWGLLMGLALSSGTEKKRFIANDLEYHDNIGRVERVARECGIGYRFVQCNDLDLDLGGETADLVFIDTWHVYGQLRRELEKFSAIATKYIVMHDTEVDGDMSESVRFQEDVRAVAAKVGFEEREVMLGLKPAIREFLARHPEWFALLIKTNNNGLTVLARRDAVLVPLLSRNIKKE